MGVVAAIAEAHERHGNKHVEILFVYVNEVVHGAYRKEGQTDGHSIPQTLQQQSALAKKMSMGALKPAGNVRVKTSQ